MPPKRSSRGKARAEPSNPAPPRVRPGILPRHRGRAYFTDELLPYDPDATRYIYRNFGRYPEAEWRAEEVASSRQRDVMGDMLASVGFEATMAEGLHYLNTLPATHARVVPSRARPGRLVVPVVPVVAAVEEEEGGEMVEEEAEEAVEEAEKAEEEEKEELEEAEQEEGEEENDDDEEDEDTTTAGPSTSKKFCPSEQNRDFKQNPLVPGVPDPALFVVRGTFKGVDTTRTYPGVANFDWNNKKSVKTLLNWRSQIYLRAGASNKKVRFFSAAETQWLEHYWTQVLSDVRSDPAAGLPSQADITAAFNAAFPASHRTQASVSSAISRPGSKCRGLKEEAERVIRDR